MPHQSDVAFMSWMMPVLHPASISEYLAFGEYGYALSRFSGMWVGFKAISEVVESGSSFAIQPGMELKEIMARGQRLEAKVLVKAVKLYLGKRLDVYWGVVREV